MRAATLHWVCVGLMACLSAQVWAVDATRLDYQLQPRQIAPDTWVIEGAVEDFSRANGCNIINTGFVSTAAGTLVLNTGPSRLYGEQQKAALSSAKAWPVKQVVSLNLHPDYFLGNQAWGDVPTAALPGSRAGMQAEGKAYEDNLYRLCGDWMRGTEFRPSRQDIQPGRFDWGGHAMEWVRLQGHTQDDLVLIDHSTGVLFAGGLVFAERVPTLPHAHLPQWIASLQRHPGPRQNRGAQPWAGAHRHPRCRPDLGLAAVVARAHADQRRARAGHIRSFAPAHSRALCPLGSLARRVRAQCDHALPAL